MKTLTIIIATLLIATVSSCDPCHELRLQNTTKTQIEVVFRPNGTINSSNGKTSTIKNINGIEMGVVKLDSAETINIGTVVARYEPGSQNINLDYLEIRYGEDRIILTGKNAILSAIQKVDKLDWRILIK